MANYLWVGKGFAYPSSEVTSPAMRVDKYSWNGPGNWMVAQVYQGVTRWMPTQAIPGGGDTVTLGYSSADGASGEYPGWIPAKCPLLFGGYSGGVGAGLYPGSTAAGTTFTNSLNDIRANVTDWDFDVGVGAGLGQVTGGDYSILSGNLKWAMEQDNLGALPGTPPITDGNYYNNNTAQTGLVGPAYRLTLKYKNLFSYTDKTWSLYDPERGANIIGATAHRGRGLEFNCVKAYTQVSSLGSTAAAVKTKFSFDCGRGQGLFIQNGSFDSIDINTAAQATLDEHYYYGFQNSGGGGLSRVGEISLRNLFAKTLSYAKCETVAVSGGTYAQINIHQYPYMVNMGQDYIYNIYTNYYSNSWEATQATSFGNSANPTDLLGFKFWDQRTTHVGCGFSGAAVYKDLYAGFSGASGGVPSVPTEFVGVLNLTNRPIEMLYPNYDYYPYIQYRTYAYLAENSFGNAPAAGITLPNVFNDTYTCTETARSHHGRIGWYNRVRAETQQVQLYIYGGLTSAAYVPVINIDGYVGPSTVAPDVHQFKWQTWELRLGGNLNIGTINNRSGLVTAYGQENESQLITVKNLRLSKYGSLDLHRADFSEYARMKFGGITGGTGGTTVTDGIIFEDNTGYIIGMGSRLIPNYTFGGRNVTKGIKDTSTNTPVAFD